MLNSTGSPRGLELQTSGARPGLRWGKPRRGFRCIRLSTRTRRHAKHQHPLCHSVSGFPFRQTEGGGLQLLRTALSPLGLFVLVSRTTLERRLLWAAVKDHSKAFGSRSGKTIRWTLLFNVTSTHHFTGFSMVRLAQMLCSSVAAFTQLAAHENMISALAPSSAGFSFSKQHHPSCQTAHFVTPHTSPLVSRSPSLSPFFLPKKDAFLENKLRGDFNQDLLRSPPQSQTRDSLCW